MGYTVRQLVRVAKRDKNKRRTYLLVNPLQAKHLPVSPTASLAMMKNLAAKVRVRDGERCTVIGFAETATAIGACLASELSEKSKYIQTTREYLAGKEIIVFEEEHSHAVVQGICKEFLKQALGDSDKLVIVDDEFSTGRTLINALRAMRSEVDFPESVVVEAVSVVNRMNGEDLRIAEGEGIAFAYEISLSGDDCVNTIDGVDTVSAKAPANRSLGDISFVHREGIIPNPRIGSLSGEYSVACCQMAELVLNEMGHLIPGFSRVLVLGTEECMFPALVLGSAIEARHTDVIVKSHATTRSPIGIAAEEGYPVRNGVRLRSLYDPERITFFYNLDAYDLTIAVTDAKGDVVPGVEDLSRALAMYGCAKMIVVMV